MQAATFLLITVLALFASSLLRTLEAAFSTISRARVENLVKDDRPGAPQLLRIMDRRADHINLLVLFATILDVTAAVFATALATELVPISGWAYAAAIIGVSLISFVIVGVYSRTMGRKNPYTISLRSAQIMGAVTKVFGPLARILIRLGNVLAPGRGFRDGPYATEVELREMVDIAQEHGIVEIEERRMIQNVFDLASTTARQVMVPRPEMIWIEGDKTAGQATKLCVRSGHSRIPVTGDNIDDIIGVVYLKDLVQQTYHLADGGESVLVRDIMREAVFTPDSIPLDDLLHRMQTTHNHLAMVVDEYGGLAGMVSMEDILEEIVGEINDEYDTDEETPIDYLGDRTFRVVARLPLEDLVDEVEDTLGDKIDFDDDITDQVDTISGLLAYEKGRVPLPGTEVTVAGLSLKAEGGRDRRGRMKVRTVLVTVADRPVTEA